MNSFKGRFSEPRPSPFSVQTRHIKKEADEALSSYSQSHTGNRSVSRISFKDRGMRAVLRIGAGSN